MGKAVDFSGLTGSDRRLLLREPVPAGLAGLDASELLAEAWVVLKTRENSGKDGDLSVTQPRLLPFAMESVVWTRSRSGHEAAGRHRLARFFAWRLTVGLVSRLMALDRERPDATDFHEPAGGLTHLRVKRLRRVVLKCVDEGHNCFPGEVGPKRFLCIFLL